MLIKELGAAQSSAQCKLGEGREAELYDLGEGRVLRLYRSMEAGSEARYQADLLRQIAGLGIRVPLVYEVVSAMGRPGIVMERLDGPDLLTDVARRPWRVLHIGAICGRLHARLNDVPAPDAVPGLHDLLRRRITESQIIPARYAHMALESLARLPHGNNLCHLDFHPGNVIVSGGEPVVIDWTIPIRSASFDAVVHTDTL